LFSKKHFQTKKGLKIRIAIAFNILKNFVEKLAALKD
jgi:hypothetical protein